ncbi:MAG: Integron integrase IntIPac [Olavius algarvensis Delta 4 endosymbiont]|nr:MAG: Integron integrase IntIPac [Olavius algarvensis Delta 4 endosymbiont]
MEEFRQYLLKNRFTALKAVDFYVHWVLQFCNYCQKHPEDDYRQEDIDRHLQSIAKHRKQWQLDQAREAIEIFRFWKACRDGKKHSVRLDTRGHWRTVASDMRKMMRLKHLALRTEQAYLGWVRRFYLFVNGDTPESLNAGHVKNFMTHLAVERKVSATTQNQGFSALLFLFRHVLNQPIEDIGKAIRAKRKKRLPVVLTQNEVALLLGELQGVNRLMAQVIYGGGLRLKECLQLRVKDIDIERKTIIIRGGKGDKDRETVLPDSIVPSLKKHLKSIRKIYEKDRAGNQPGVELPGALERKMPNASTEWAWFWVFPSHTLSTDPRSGIVRRHHIHKSVLQKHIKKATTKAQIPKRVTVHTLRHCFATHLVEQGCDIRTIQELLGHRHLETTMIYTHVAQTNRLGIVSPLDKNRKNN